MQHFPFEVHELSIKLKSPLTTQSVKLTVAGKNPSEYFDSVPDAWTLKKGWVCTEGSTTETETARGGSGLEYAYVECTCEVSKVDWSWWLNSFILFLTVVLTNCFLSIGRKC